MKKNYGWKRDLPDFRDLRYKTIHKYSIQDLPPSVDLRSKCSPVENQNQLGSCTSFALAGALEFLEEQSLVTKIASPEILAPNAYQSFSHLFIYYNERDAEGDPLEDGGGQLRDGIKTLASLGCCTENVWPYDESKVFVKPLEQAYNEALQHKITSYYRVDNTNLYELKHALSQGFPITFGFSVFSYFESQNMATCGILNVPESNEECLGGHAVLMVGYDDSDRMFWVRNSWGNWGPFLGYFKMSYDYACNPNLADDFWVIQR